MSDYGDKLTIDCSLGAPADAAAIAAMEDDAMELLRSSNLDGARNVLDQIERIRADADQPRETREPLSDADIAQREDDVAEAGEHQIAVLRAERDARLLKSDWTQMPDAGLSEAATAAWTRYRQELRDWPQTVTDPFDPPPWPDPPNGG